MTHTNGDMAERALVLGGGGVAGIAWATGLLAGLAESGADVTGADLLLGSSAGSVVAAQFAGGTPLPELLRTQVDPARQYEELAPLPGSLEATFEVVTALFAETQDLAEFRRRMGDHARAAETVPAAARRAVIEARLPVHTWPERHLEITAVDTDSGELRLLDRESGIGLVDAVAASCAVPGVWPPITLDGALCVDGGIPSSNNLVRMVGRARRILVVAPMPDPLLEADLALAAESGARVEVITPDEAALAAFGTDPLSPSSRTPAGRAGVDQGRAAAVAVKALWA